MQLREQGVMYFRLRHWEWRTRCTHIGWESKTAVLVCAEVPIDPSLLASILIGLYSRVAAEDIWRRLEVASTFVNEPKVAQVVSKFIHDTPWYWQTREIPFCWRTKSTSHTQNDGVLRLPCRASNSERRPEERFYTHRVRCTIPLTGGEQDSRKIRVAKLKNMEFHGLLN